MTDEATETHNPRTKIITLNSLNMTLTLRPLPIFLCKEISKELRPLIEKIQKTGRIALVIQKQIEAQQEKYINQEIKMDELVSEISKLADKAKEATPENIDEEAADAIIEVFYRVMKFYRKENPPSIHDIEAEVSMADVIFILDEQVLLNSNQDFLLNSLNLILSIVKKSGDDVKKLITTT